MKKLIDKCKECTIRKVNINEMQTKTSLIIPFFRHLGYDVEDYGVFKAELNCGRERVDYAILKNGQPNILIETKKLNENLDVHLSQISKYMKYHETATVGILTNGEEYRFYIKNNSSLKEVWRLNLSNLLETDNELISKCIKKGLDVITNEVLMKPYILDLTIKNIIAKPSKEILNVIKINSGIENLSNADIKNTFERIFKIETLKDEEVFDYKLDKKYKTLKNQDFTEKEIELLLVYRELHGFSIQQSMKIWVGNYYYSNCYRENKTEVILSEMLDGYVRKTSENDFKRKEYIYDNKEIFSGIIKKIILKDYHDYNLIDDVFHNNKLYSKNKKKDKNIIKIAYQKSS